MSELEKKLARRRKLNGEPGGGAGNVADTGDVRSVSNEPNTEIYSAPSSSTTSNSAPSFVSNTSSTEIIPSAVTSTTPSNSTVHLSTEILKPKSIAINSSKKCTIAGVAKQMTSAAFDVPSTVGKSQTSESRAVSSVDPINTTTTSPDKSRLPNFRQTASTSSNKRLSTHLSRSSSHRLEAGGVVGSPSHSPSKRVSGSKNMAAQLMQYQKSKDLSPEKKSTTSEAPSLTANSTDTPIPVSVSLQSKLMTAMPVTSLAESVSSKPILAKSNITSSQLSQPIHEVVSTDSSDSVSSAARRKSAAPGKINIQGLNINVEALKPGAKLPTHGASTSAITSPTTTRTEVMPTVSTTSTSEALIKPVHSQEGNENLNHMNMQRPIINSRRRAQTRNLDRIREDGTLSSSSSRLPSIDEYNANPYDFQCTSTVLLDTHKNITTPQVVTCVPPAKPIKPAKCVKSPVFSPNNMPIEAPTKSLHAQPILQAPESVVVLPSGDSASGTFVNAAASPCINVAQIEERIREIYTVHNPAKLAELPTLLQRSRGSEDVLLARIEAKYIYKCPPLSVNTTATLPAASASVGSQVITAAANSPSSATEESVTTQTSENIVVELNNIEYAVTEPTGKKTVAVLSSKSTIPTTSPSQSVKTSVPTIETATLTSHTAVTPPASVRSVHSTAFAKVMSPLQTTRSEQDRDDGPSSSRSYTSIASTDSTKSISPSPVPAGVQQLSKVHCAAKGSIVRARASSLLTSPQASAIKDDNVVPADTTSDSLAEFEVDDSGSDSLMLSLDNVYGMDQNGSISYDSDSKNISAFKELVASLKNQNSILVRQLRLRDLQVAKLEREVAELKNMVFLSGSGLKRGQNANEFGGKTILRNFYCRSTQCRFYIQSFKISFNHSVFQAVL